jgi:hypothetical protein
MAMKYAIGQHGAKRREQRRLSRAHGEPVTGRTHESEHTIGFAPLNQSAEAKRGKSKASRKLEKEAWAYQEVKGFHRSHIGTGTQATEGLSGFNSDTYRQTQRDLIEKGNVSSAVQVNQLGYAFLPKFTAKPDAPNRRAANDSFEHMVRNMDRVDYAEGKGIERVIVTSEDRAEMYLSRLVASGQGEGTGGWPSIEQIKTVKKLFEA